MVLPARLCAWTNRARGVGRGGLLLPAAGPLQQELALAFVRAELGRAGELLARLGVAAQFEQQIAADAGEQVIIAEGALPGEGVGDLEPRLRPEREADGDGAVELDDRGGGECGEAVVERDDPL